MLTDNSLNFSSLSAVCYVCPLKRDVTTPQLLLFLSVRPSTYLPVPLSFLFSSDSSINLLFLSIRLSICLPCLGCVDSSLVSCRRSVFLRHGHWSDACTLSADGQVTILSHTFLLSYFISLEKFIWPIPWLAAADGLPFSVICFHLCHLPSDHLVAGELMETGTERLLKEIMQSPAFRKSASWFQNIFPFLFIFPVCLYHDSNDVPRETDKPQTA